MYTRFKSARDPISSYSHFIGAFLSLIGTFLLSMKIINSTDMSLTVTLSCLLFGFSLMALYSSSCIYHYVHVAAEKLLRLRKLDHAMIYVLIAGSYTPILLNFITGTKGILFTVMIWTCALAGIAMKLLWFNAPRLLYTGLYVLMGWAIVFDVQALTAIPAGGLFLLALGGIAYTIGGVIYALKKPNLSQTFGFHELFHIFVLLGSFMHFLLVFFYVA